MALRAWLVKLAICSDSGPIVSLTEAPKRRRRAEFLFLAVALLLCYAPALGTTSDELERNGLLSQGHGGQPTGWTHMAYFSDPKSTRFGWEVDTEGIGVLKIANLKPNDSRWVQTIAVSPSTWYRVSGWIRSENVERIPIGAHLSVGGAVPISPDLRGTADWRLVEFWLQTNPDQKSMDLECRLGSFSSLTTGTAYFTAISVSRGEPPQAIKQMSGGAVAERPNRHKIFVWLFDIILTLSVIFLLWRLVLPAFGRTLP